MRRACKHLVVVALVCLFAGLGMTSSYQEGSLAQTAPPKPNIIFILTDDMRKDDLNPTYMPQTTTELVKKGMSFQNAFVSNPLCCPSRATIMRGQYGHNTDIWFNTNIFDPDPNVRDGGWLGYNGNGYEKDNVATHLHDPAAGYTTGFFGKYLNGYIAAGTTKPPGWDDWFAFKQPGYYNYDVNDNGTIKHFGSRSTDYSTDVLNAQVKEFIRANAGQSKPFFAYVAPYAPHAPSTPGPLDKTSFNGLKAPRLPSFNEADVTDKPDWIKSLRKLTSTDIANINQRHENRIESLQAVDDLVGAVVSTLGEKPGVLSNTYIVFTSDNGWHHGEHRIRQGKGRPYEESVRVPLVIRGPDAVAPATPVVQPDSSTDKLVLNTDYFPTFMDLAGTQTPSYVDGRSLLPVLTGSTTTSWRTAILIEGRGNGADPEIEVDRNYNAVRTSTGKYVEYEGGFRELYDLRPVADPNELTNTYSTDPADLKARLDALRGCHPDDLATPEDESCQTAEGGP